jgi:alcohol dehydrogenase class IV
MTSRRDVRYGNGAVRGLAEIVSELGAQRVFLVCGGRSFEASGAGLALPDLERVAQVRRWSDFAPNTDAADLVRGLALTQEFEPDWCWASAAAARWTWRSCCAPSPA